MRESVKKIQTMNIEYRVWFSFDSGKGEGRRDGVEEGWQWEWGRDLSE